MKVAKVMLALLAALLVAGILLAALSRHDGGAGKTDGVGGVHEGGSAHTQASPSEETGQAPHFRTLRKKSVKPAG